MAVEGAIAAPASSREANTAALVRRLVRSTLAARGVRADDSERATERLYRYAVRLVGSCLASSVEPDEGATADAIKRKLTREGSATAAVKFAELHRRLAQQPGLKSRWAVLHALLQVSEDRRAEDHAVVPAGGGIGAGAATARHIADPLSSAAAAGGLPSLSDPDPRSLAANDGSTLGLDHPGSRALAYRELNAEAEANLEIGEQELVRDVLFACQGIDGKHVRYNSKMASYVVDPAAPVRPGARDLARKLTELGWLFRR